MKRITNTQALLLSGLLTVLLCAVGQAQGARLQQKKIATPTSTAESPATTAPQETQPTRPNAVVTLANPRLQAIVLDQFLPRIALTPEQTTRIRQLRFQHIRKMRTLLDLERAQTRVYDEALFDPAVDAKEIEKRTTQLAEARADMLKAQAQFFLDLRQVLTPEQITKLRQLMEEERAAKQKNTP